MLGGCYPRWGDEEDDRACRLVDALVKEFGMSWKDVGTIEVKKFVRGWLADQKYKTRIWLNEYLADSDVPAEALAETDDIKMPISKLLKMLDDHAQS
jgi:hypothetical protein